MYIDPVSRIPYGHNHAIYICGCKRVVGQCLCRSSDKEIIRFDDCLHTGKKFPSDYPIRQKRKPRFASAKK